LWGSFTGGLCGWSPVLWEGGQKGPFRGERGKSAAQDKKKISGREVGET